MFLYIIAVGLKYYKLRKTCMEVVYFYNISIIKNRETKGFCETETYDRIFKKGVFIRTTRRPLYVLVRTFTGGVLVGTKVNVLPHKIIDTGIHYAWQGRFPGCLGSYDNAKFAVSYCASITSDD